MKNSTAQATKLGRDMKNLLKSGIASITLALGFASTSHAQNITQIRELTPLVDGMVRRLGLDKPTGSGNNAQ